MSSLADVDETNHNYSILELARSAHSKSSKDLVKSKSSKELSAGKFRSEDELDANGEVHESALNSTYFGQQSTHEVRKF